MSDDLAERLAAAAADVNGAVRVAPVAEVRARAGRRRFQAVGAVTIAAATIGAAVVVSVGASVLIRPTGDPAGRRVELVMPHEGEPGWQRNDDPNVAAAWAGCATTDPTRDG